MNDLVTIAEAAKALGVDPRQIRRYVDRLEPTDKGQDTQRTHKGHPIILVRLSAVEALRAGETRGESNGQSQRTGQDSQGTVSDGSRDKGQDTTANVRDYVSDLLAEKDARIAELTRSLEIEREAHKRAELLHLNTQGELSALRDRAAQLEQLNTKLIEALPERKPDPEPPEDPYQNRTPVTTSATQESDTGQGRVVTPTVVSAGKSETDGTLEADEQHIEAAMVGSMEAVTIRRYWNGIKTKANCR